MHVVVKHVDADAGARNTFVLGKSTYLDSQASRIGSMVRVPALSSGGNRFESR